MKRREVAENLASGPMNFYSCVLLLVVLGEAEFDTRTEGLEAEASLLKNPKRIFINKSAGKLK